MQDLIKTLREIANTLEFSDLTHKREILVKDDENAKLRRGNETLQEVIKMKDDYFKDITDSYKDALQSIRGKKPEVK